MKQGHYMSMLVCTGVPQYLSAERSPHLIVETEPEIYIGGEGGPASVFGSSLMAPNSPRVACV